MDLITAAIVAAISSSMTEVGKEGVLDAYKALKTLLSKKFGSHSPIAKAVEDLEHNPSSQARTAVLQEEVVKAKADQDPELYRIAYTLHQQVNHSSVGQSNQVVYGNKNVQQQAGQNAYHVSGRGNVAKAGRDIINGRPGLIVLMAIVLVAIFAFLMWQLFPSIRQFVLPTPKTSSFNANSEGTLFWFCHMVQSGASDDAYTLTTSDNFQKQNRPQDFNQQWGVNNHPSSCISSINSSSDTAATGTIATEMSGSGQNRVDKVTLVEKDGLWEIDTIQIGKPSLPSVTAT